MAARELARERDRRARALGTESQRGARRTYTWMPRLPVVFGTADDAELVEQRVHVVRGRARVVEVGAGLRVEVDAQLVGVLGVVGA